MKTTKNYIQINKKSWNNKTESHVNSEFYDMKGFLSGQNSLNEIELELLDDVKGKSILHLQCHFGQDSISLSRLGAEVTGVDFSDKAIAYAKQISTETKNKTTFICCNIYDLPDYLDKEFDIVFTSYGTIGWLPDLNQWASIISRFLKPKGQFIFAEFHPVVWMFDDKFKNIAYNYFNTEAIIESEEGTYADKSAAISQEYVMWNHPLSEVISSLLDNNLQISTLKEYNYSPYNCFNNTEEIEFKKFRIKHLDDKIPMVYSLSAIKTQ